MRDTFGFVDQHLLFPWGLKFQDANTFGSKDGLVYDKVFWLAYTIHCLVSSLFKGPY